MLILLLNAGERSLASFKLNTPVICHSFNQDEKPVRIISARKADKDEANAYWSM